ncbi:tyrosine-type recombinase/integrase [Gimesia algae]|uniref:Prophage phiRv2 integrase n=1 Tax=Gimesia algae TaxID=2527971 RepID=A0A517VME2_9PLAN|nr:site-specific integrase [Gimesia algae]QDT94145.1 Putative prophage phiRv2 integrase [Gimesia algae]
MKRSNGEGTVFKNAKTGKWVAQVTYYQDGKRKRKTKTSRNRSDANSNLRKLHEEVESGFVSSGTETVGKYLKSWLENVQRENSENMFLSATNIMQNHVIPLIGRKHLVKLSPMDVQNMIDRLRDNGVGGRSVQMAYEYLNSAMVRAYAFRMIRENPCGPIRKPKHSYAKANPFTVEEVQALLKYLKGHRFYNLVFVALTTGMRPGEVFGLFWENVDLDNAKIHVKQQLSNAGGKKKIIPPKTKSSIRTVDISDATVTALIEQRKQLVKSGHAGSEYVFLGRNGASVGYINFQKIWTNILSKAGVQHRGFHHVRHTFATLAISSGVPITVISATLGHGNTATTLQTYAHAMPSQRSDATNAVSKMIG